MKCYFNAEEMEKVLDGTDVDKTKITHVTKMMGENKVNEYDEYYSKKTAFGIVCCQKWNLNDIISYFKVNCSLKQKKQLQSNLMDYFYVG